MHSPAARSDGNNQHPMDAVGAPVMAPGYTFATVTEKIAKVTLSRKTPFVWLIGFLLSFAVMQLMLVAVVNLLFRGIGVWGPNVPIGWGFDIINFVWWIGIGHAGTLISAILLLLRQGWRTSINRFAEAMTLFAVACAAFYPIFHTGRPWVAAYWLLPYPSSMGLWPNFRSPLIWDVFAVSTYATASALFWFTGLIPDFATLRDRAKSKPWKYAYGLLAGGWRGSIRHWHNYEMSYLLLAGLCTPLVISVHTVVSFDFATSLIPGWHATIFPPYFVAGAVYAGFAMVLTLAIPLRRWYQLEDFITMRHLENMAKVMLTTGLVVFYGYVMEAFMGWYSGNLYERFTMWNRMFGPYWHMYWLLILCNGVTPQLLWWKRVRTSIPALFGISMVVSVGMWLERYVIIVTSLHRDFLPSSWGMYAGTLYDWAAFIGTLGLFCTLLFLFVRFLPAITMFEMRMLVPGALVPHHGHPQPHSIEEEVQ